MVDPGSTHEVFNQSPAFADVDLYALDRPLAEAVAANGAAQESEALSAFGRHWGRAEMFEQARLANEFTPRLKTHDAKGVRRDEVEFHPAYHRFMTESTTAGLQGSTWTASGRRAAAPAEVARAARFYLVAQVENGHMCPITMTRAAVGALNMQPDLVTRIVPKIVATAYDGRFKPFFEKSSITLGMGMTEKQGGTDVRANTTRAIATGDGYRIDGHKWFLSAPMSDAFLVLAQTVLGDEAGGPSCFLMPRFRPDGRINGLRLQRLKDKLGNRSNASAEVEFVDAFAWPVGEEGRGVRTILNMVQLTRLDCAIASAGMMRMALVQALHHARHRQAFGRALAVQPLMRSVLADLALDVEGAVALVMRLARAFDRAGADPAEAAYARLMTPVVKYWVCKAAPAFVYEAMECLGGNGYVEDGVMARLYREAPVNAIWEGAGNVMCLDVLRVIARENEAAMPVLGALGEAKSLPGVSAALSSIAAVLAAPNTEARARAAVERLAQLAAVSALAGHAPAVAELFARTRLDAPHGFYGSAALDAVQAKFMLDRALPGV